ncbi:NACHT domain-containing protein [Streptomyces sp. NPDC090022]|uniref:NACHT domain-containing protein n=1 Tax=Streptomyces sp. NPDC090022 TaxID=3365920 RepID=UPI00380129DE
MDPAAPNGILIPSGVIGPIIERLLRRGPGYDWPAGKAPVRLSAYLALDDGRRPAGAELQEIAEALVEAALAVAGERPLPVGGRARAADALSQSLNALGGLEVHDLGAVQNGHEALARAVHEADVYLHFLSPDTSSFHDRLLTTVCLHVLYALARRSAFVRAGVPRQTLLLAEQVAAADAAAARLPRPDASDAAFERRYRDHIVSRYSELTIFGIDLTRSPAKWPLDAAYMTLEAADTSATRVTDPADAWVLNPATGEYELNLRLTGYAEAAEPGPADQVLARHGRVLLRGEAGSGKTTLIQWLAVSATRPDPEERMTYVSGLVPFVLPLRTLARRPGGLPEPADFLYAVGAPVAGDQPVGWADRVLRAGRGLVLVDGIDEVSEEVREHAHAWLAGLIGEYPDNRWLITSRPSAVPAAWLDAQRFAALTLSEMTPSDVAAFVRRWHTAARTGTPEDEELPAYEEQLLKALRSKEDVGRLATNPLLCGLICALHRDRHGFLPLSRKDLYTAALSMLLSRRDRERKVPGPQLRDEPQIQALQRLAVWLIRNKASEMDRRRAESVIGEALPSLPSLQALGDARAVFTRFLERTGLLREPAPGSVHFIHRTFQDFLGARALVDESGWRELALHAEDDLWEDVIRMAVAQARPRELGELLKELLARKTPRAALLAFASLEDATEIAPDVRAEVQKAVQQLIPPQSADAARALASAGPLVLGLLPGPDDVALHHLPYVIQAAAKLGTDRAMGYLTQFCQEASPAARTALAAAWEHFDARRYAEEVLARLDPDGVTFTVTSDAQLEVLAEVAPQASLTVRGYVSQAAIAAYANRVPLRSLTVSDNWDMTGVGFLRGHEELTHVSFRACNRLRDLRGLEHAGITTAWLGLGEVTDSLYAVSTWHGLRLLALSGPPLRAWSPSHLDPSIRLHQLGLGECPQGRVLKGLLRQQELHTLHLDDTTGPRSAVDWNEIAGLPHLGDLMVAGPDLATAPRGLELSGVMTLRFASSKEPPKAVIKRIPQLFPALRTLQLNLVAHSPAYIRLLPSSVYVEE